MIELEYPKILSTDLSNLPDEIYQKIRLKFDGHKYLTDDMILTPVNTEGAYERGPSQEKSARQTLQETLQGIPITNKEWSQVVNLVRDFNNEGFRHSDLENNIFFRRDDNGKLIITIIDFEAYGEDYGDYDDISALETIRIKLEAMGAKEKAAQIQEDDFIIAPTSEDTEESGELSATPIRLSSQNNKFSFKLPSWVLPAVGIGLLAATLSEPATESFALASLPFFGSIFGIRNNNPEATQFLKTRQRFEGDIFNGPSLDMEDREKLTEILGEETFNLWQKYYNKNLRRMIRRDLNSLKDLIKYSNRYESTLPTLIRGRFPGTNPLYVHAMKTITEKFEEDLLNGKTFEEAVKDIGNLMFKYHLSKNQIEAFLKYKREDTSIFWDKVAVPEAYSFNYEERGFPGQIGYDIGFGILSKEKGIAFTPFNENAYGEYVDKLFNSISRPRIYRGVNLSFYNSRTNHLLEYGTHFIDHPEAITQDGNNNITRMFEAIQKDYNNIEPIIMKSRRGEGLSAEDKKTLDDNIAEISYLFTNAKPFYRGSASAGLAIVYGLYDMAGIQVPQVKKNYALDLEAFATTPEQYKENWLDLFDGEFTSNNSVKEGVDILTPTSLSNEDPAATNSSGPISLNNDPVSELSKSVFRLQTPTGMFSGYLTELPLFGQKRQAIITVGHGLMESSGTGVDVFNVFGDHVTKADALFHKFNFSKESNTVEDFALLIPRKRIQSPALSLAFDEDIYSRSKVLLLSFPRGQFYHQSLDPAPYMSQMQDIPNVSYLQGGGDFGSSGGAAFVATELDKFSVAGTIFASFNKYGEDFTAIHNLQWLKKIIEGTPLDVNLFSTKFTLSKGYQEPSGTVVNTDISLLNPTSFNFLDIAKLELVPSNSMAVGKRAVWKAYNSENKLVGYLKYGTEEEITRTKLFHKIVTENNLAEKYPLVNLEYPQIITEDISFLPSAVQQKLNIELDKVRTSLWGRNRGRVPFIMTVINTDGFTYYDALKSEKEPFIKEKLGGEGITKAEWEQATSLIAEINEHGFVHEDFVNNFYVRRNEEGKLSLSTLDFETAPNGVPDNVFEMEIIENSLNKMGLIKEAPVAPLNNVVQARLVPVNDELVAARAVWELLDGEGKTVGYLKYGNDAEIGRAKLLHKIITENNLLNGYTLFDFEYPEVLTENVTSLNGEVMEDVTEDFESIKDYMRNASRRAKSYFVTTPIDANGFVVGQNSFFPTKEAGHLAADKLNNQMITDEEWIEIEDFFRKLNDKGFVHEDLINNMFFSRSKDGKLKISILDFEPLLNQPNNVRDLRIIKNYFNGLKPYFTPSILQNVTRAELVVTERGNYLTVHAVWRLYDSHGKVIGYLKYGTPEEIKNTKNLHEIFSTKGFREKFNSIGIEFPQILAEDVMGMPEDILQGIKDEFDRIKHLVRDPDIRAKTMFVLSPINENGFCWGNTRSGREGLLFAQVKLNNKPITSVEWGTVVDLIMALNQKGVYYDDIYNNLFFRRDKNNKLIVSLIDFENENYSNSLRDLQNLGNMFNAIGIKEPSFYYDNMFPYDLEEEYP